MRLSSGIFQILLIACAGAAQAQSWHALDGTMRKAEAVRPAIERMMAAAKVPSLGVAVIDNGQVVWQQAFGEVDPAAHIPLRTDTIMYGASLTKAASCSRNNFPRTGPGETDVPALVLDGLHHLGPTGIARIGAAKAPVKI